MKKLLNTLYITSPDGYLSLDGENVVVLDKEKEVGGFRCIIWKPLFLLATEVQARHLWEDVRKEIFHFVS